MTRRKLAISCTDRAWEQVRKRAAARHVSASRYALERALTADPPPRAPAGDAEPLVLDAAGQRALLAAVTRIDTGLREGGGTAEMLDQLSRRAGMLVRMAMEAWVRAGHEERLLAIAADMLEAERMPAVREWIRRLGRDRPA